MAVSIVGTPSASHVSTTNIAAGASRNFAHTVAAGTGALLVLVYTRAFNSTTFTVKWGGTSGTTLTQLFDTAQNNGNTDDQTYWIGILENPATGSNNITVTNTHASADLRGPVVAAWNISGHDTATPVTILAEQAAAGSAGTAISLSGTIPTGALGIFALGAQASSTPTLSSITSTGWTERYNGSHTANSLQSTVIKDTTSLTGAQTVSATTSVSDIDRGGVFFVVNQTAAQNYDDAATESVTAGESSDASLSVPAAASESVTATDATDTALGVPAAATESVTVTDTAASTHGGDNSLAESISAGDDATPSVGVPGALTETVGLTDDTASGLVFLSDVTEAVTPADASNYALDVPGDVTETVTPADTADAPGMAAVASGAETVTAAESSLANLSSGNAVSETVTPADDQAAGFDLPASAAETVTPADAVEAGLVYPVDAADTVTLTDDVAVDYVAGGTGVSESVAVTDTAASNMGYPVDRGDVVTLVDDQAGNVGLSLSVAEAFTPADATDGEKRIEVSCSEGVTVTDTAVAAHSLVGAVTDSVTVTDALSLLVDFGGSILEIITAADDPDILIDVEVSQIEAVTLTETITGVRVSAEVGGGIKGRQQLLAPGEYIELYDIDLSQFGGPVFHFQNNAVTIKFDGIDYVPFPIKAEGFEATSEGETQRPTLKVSNAIRSLAAELQNYDNFRGAVVTRTRTLYRYTDEQPDADPEAKWPLDIYRIDRASGKTKAFIDFELVPEVAFVARKIPHRRVLRSYCQHSYRRYVDGNFVYGSCPYRRSAYFTRDDDATSNPAQDKCSKRLSGCRLRFNGGTEPLPMRAFPQVSRRGT